MKLYYATGTCSLSPRIVAFEAGLPLDAEKVDIGAHKTETGADYFSVNPKGYVPALRLDDGSLLTEGVAMVQYLADRAPQSGLAPAAGTPARYRLQEWLTFISSELHKVFSPWLFSAATPEATKAMAKSMIGKRFAMLDQHLAGHAYLMGDKFTAADAYCFTIVDWSRYADIDLEPYAHLRAFMARVAARPKVKEAMRAEGMQTV
jgi:glutathione S-transferase